MVNFVVNFPLCSAVCCCCLLLEEEEEEGGGVTKVFIESCVLCASSIARLAKLYSGATPRYVMISFFYLLQLIPWRHFGRKNLGYLFAIAHGRVLPIYSLIIKKSAPEKLKVWSFTKSHSDNPPPT